MASSPDTQTLRRILLLEQSQGFQDHAVIGGMERYVQVSPAPVGGQDARDPAAWRTAVLQLLRDYHALTASQRREAVEQALTLLSSPAESDLPRQRLRTTDAGETAAAASPVRSAPQKPTGKRRSPSARPPTGSSPRLTDPVDRLKGVGPANAKRLAVLGVSTVQDLIYHFPRRYDDFAQRKQIKQLALGDQVTVVGAVRSTGLRRTGGRSLFRATLSDETGAIECTWFNQPHLDRSLTKGLQIAVSGQVSEYRGRLVFSSPEWEPLHPDLLNTGRVVPVYPLTQGLYARSLRRLIHDALDLGVPQIVDSLPSETRESAGLIDLQTALRQIHFPDSAEEMQRARERLSFDELLMLQLGVLRKRGEWRREPGAAISVSPEVTDSFLAGLPFALTQAQDRAIADILKDMAQPVPMSRLLQGDVGSGKTVVAVAAMLGAVRAGYQAALMAPTSILAEQHAGTITRMLESMPDVRVGLLEGSQPAAEKAAVRDGLARGDVDIIIGTHALIQEKVAFDRLGLIIVDE
ncbi:MAG: DEAD/DEAH box helicase, partial [Anaerolineae bacterium]